MSRRKPLSNLFELGRIGSIVTRNRIVMAPIASACVATDDGAVTDRVIDYYEARARGGVGLIVVGSAAVEFPLGISGKPRLNISGSG